MLDKDWRRFEHNTRNNGIEPKFYAKYLIVIEVDLRKTNDVGNNIFRTQRCLNIFR